MKLTVLLLGIKGIIREPFGNCSMLFAERNWLARRQTFFYFCFFPFTCICTLFLNILFLPSGPEMLIANANSFLREDRLIASRCMDKLFFLLSALHTIHYYIVRTFDDDE